MRQRERQAGVMAAMTTGERALGMVLTTLSFGLVLVYALTA